MLIPNTPTPTLPRPRGRELDLLIPNAPTPALPRAWGRELDLLIPNAPRELDLLIPNTPTPLPRGRGREFDLLIPNAPTPIKSGARLQTSPRRGREGCHHISSVSHMDGLQRVIYFLPGVQQRR